MSVADLRARALAHNATIRFTYPICLDDDLRQAIKDAEKALKDLHTAVEEAKDRRGKSEATQRRSLGEAATPGHDKEIAALEARIPAAEEALAAAEDAALADSVLLRFRRLTPSEYQEAWDAAGEAAKDAAAQLRDAVKLEALKERLRTHCYAAAEDAEGNDLGIGWDEAVDGFIGSGDFDNIGNGLILFNRASAAIPFGRASSGQPATS
ncbi:hypothetical protein GCM10009785_34790 [Brooklawnia cerclae]|uniref:Uncharacterized protein n=1 Tax=Brooklawnia cerclae TaxID=349934 RepID=A0ABX0SJA2_9ACTN|nr:hypothetical protein [Brooklawnia cerclae]NIH58468.1 hypothetical protein [Brooklawnia cerclae]